MKYPPRIEKMRQRLLDEIVATLEYLQYLRNQPVLATNVLQREEAKKRMLVRRLSRLESGR